MSRFAAGDGGEAAGMTQADALILKAEVVALQAVLIPVFRSLAARPELHALFCEAFDEAEATVTGVAIKMGMEAPLESTVGALRVIEELRAAVIRDERRCRPADGGEGSTA